MTSCEHQGIFAKAHGAWLEAVTIVTNRLKVSHCNLLIVTKTVKWNQRIWATSWQNQQNGMCAQRRLWSAWASAQSDQSLNCLHEEAWVHSYPLSISEDSDQTGHMPRLIWVFAGRTVILLLMSWGGSIVKIQTAWKLKNYAVIILNFLQKKRSKQMANRADPDQTAPLLGAVWSGSTLFTQICLSKYLEQLRYLAFTKVAETF